jgi:parvulin-like peptidyl-prolyl isomerase
LGTALLVGIIFTLLASVYHNRWGHSRETVVSVGDQHFSLGYYADRLEQVALANPSESLGITEQTLLRKLEEEGITIILAREKGVDLSRPAINAAIAEKLGVPLGGNGSPYDTALRARIASLKTTEGYFRLLTTAETADKKLAELLKGEVGDTGEGTTLRIVAVASKEIADVMLGRIQAGEDMGTIAQTESSHLQSKSQDGLLDPLPTSLLSTPIADAIAGKGTGELIGPVEVSGQWWLIRVEKRDPALVYNQEQKTQLADKKVTEAITAKRSSVKIKRDIDSGDIAWAVNKITP